MVLHPRFLFIVLLGLAAGHATADEVSFCINRVSGSVRVPKNPMNPCIKGFETLVTIPTVGGPSFTYKIGDTGPGGGIVFFVDYHGQYPGFDYLEAAPADLPGGYYWCGPFDAIPAVSGWEANAVGRGKANTDAIIAAGCNKATDAAQAAKSYDGGGKADWFLPSMGELVLMHTNLRQAGLGGFQWPGSYWSSTEFSSFHALYLLSRYNTEDYDVKHAPYLVRPVRAF